jgi:predicted kinase
VTTRTTPHPEATRPILVLTGSIGSGKTTIAVLIAARTGAVHLSSDALRGPHGHPFDRMRNALESTLAHGKRAILDSTGMSYRFRAIVDRFRARIYHAHLTVDPLAWHEREQQRGDRAPLDAGVYRHSAKITFTVPPDLVVDTTQQNPEETAAFVLAAWERGS